MKRAVTYVRVSTDDQDTKHQRIAIDEYLRPRVNQMFRDAAFADDAISGMKFNRPGLLALMDYIKEEQPDVLIVWRLDRLGRSLIDMLNIIEQIHKAGTQIVSLTENIDSATAAGEMQMHLILAFAHYERRLISERTKLAMSNVPKERINSGWRIKRGQARITDQEREEWAKLFASGKNMTEIARMKRCHRETVMLQLRKIGVLPTPVRKPQKPVASHIPIL